MMGVSLGKQKTMIQNWQTYGAFALCVMVLCLWSPSAFAVDVFSDKCTFLQLFNLQAAKLTPALQGVILLVDAAVQKAMENLYDGIVGSDGYATSLGAAVTLYIIFYAIAFMFGIAQITMAQAAIRIMKIAVVFAFVSPVGWNLYESTVVTLFRDGGEFLTAQVSALTPATDTWANISIGDINLNFGPGGFGAGVTTGVAAPIAVFQGVVKAAISPRMFVLIYACFGTGPFGAPMGLIMMWAVFQILGMIMKAMEVYGLSIVVKAILLGLGPIFIVFILFDRTKPLFMGWLNQLTSFTLQPIFMFAFLAFYLGMLESAIWDMVPDVAHAATNIANGQLTAPVEACFNSADQSRNGQNDVKAWRFNYLGVDPFQGGYNFKGPVGLLSQVGGALGVIPVFPITILSTLIVLLLAYIGKQLITASTELANDIASGAVNLAGSAGNGVTDMAQTYMAGR
jgi:type IV secretory pathway VirB6-like protein